MHALRILLVFAVFVVAPVAGAKDETRIPPQKVQDRIPAKWDDYFLNPDLILKNQGPQKSEICFDADFMKTPSNFETLSVRNAASGRGGMSETRHYKRLKGASDFTVISKDALLINTPETGLHIIKTKYCRKHLNRAKSILFRSDTQRSNARHCMHAGGNLSIMTRRKSGIAACRIKTLHEWTGSFDPDALKAASDQRSAQSP